MSQGHTEEVCLVLSLLAVLFSAILFVDDMDLPIISWQGKGGEALRTWAQWKVSDWQRGLQVTGGDLKVAKCYWCWISFHWQKGQWKYTPVSQLPGDLLLNGPVRQGDSQPEVIL